MLGVVVGPPDDVLYQLLLRLFEDLELLLQAFVQVMAELILQGQLVDCVQGLSELLVGLLIVWAAACK